MNTRDGLTKLLPAVRPQMSRGLLPDRMQSRSLCFRTSRSLENAPPLARGPINSPPTRHYNRSARSATPQEDLSIWQDPYGAGCGLFGGIMGSVTGTMAAEFQ